jgi:hypothetical protein
VSTSGGLSPPLSYLSVNNLWASWLTVITFPDHLEVTEGVRYYHRLYVLMCAACVQCLLNTSCVLRPSKMTLILGRDDSTLVFILVVDLCGCGQYCQRLGGTYCTVQRHKSISDICTLLSTCWLAAALQDFAGPT